MKTLALAAGVCALALVGCTRPFPGGHHRALHAVSQLDCPQSHGAFERQSAASDGKSCTYSGPDGSQVVLKLVSFSGDPDTVLDPLEAQMKTLLPPAPSIPPASATPASSGWAEPGGKGKDRDNVNIDLPGIHIHAGDENANVHVGGIHIDADDKTNSVKINGNPGRRGQFTVNADDNGAVIRTQGFGENLERSLVMVSKEPGPSGLRTVAYEAVGPRQGPLVVANYQSRQDNHDSTFEEVKEMAWKAAR